MSQKFVARRDAGLLLLVLLPAVVACALMVYFSDPMPLADDYNSVIAFSTHYYSLTSTVDRLLYILAAQHNEYKFVVEHLIIAADLTLTHRLHLSFLQFIGDLFLPAILWLLWVLTRRPGDSLQQRLLLFIPVSFLFCGVNYVDAVSYPSSCLNYPPGIFFSMATLMLLARPRLTPALFGLACLTALLGYCSAINAFLMFPLGAWILFRQKAYPRLAVWTVMLAIALAIYLYRYQPTEHLALGSFAIMPLFFISFVGCTAPVHQLAIVFGLVMLGIAAWGFKTGFARSNPASFWCLLWLLITSAMTTYGRSHFGLGMAVSSRYQLFSSLMLIFVYQILVERLLPGLRQRPQQARAVYAIIFAASLLLFMRADYLGVRYFRDRRVDVQMGLAQFLADPAHGTPMYYANPFHEQYYRQAEIAAGDVTRQAIADRILFLPPQ